MNWTVLRNFIINTNNDYKYTMNIYERYAPFIILAIFITIIILNKDRIRSNKKIDTKIRVIFSFVILAITSFYYIGNWIVLGINVNNLPFHLCYLCTILSIILSINKNKKIFNFILVCGIIGGVSSFISIDLSLSSKYFKYYQFLLSHIAIIILPIYFRVIYKYKLNISELIKVFVQLEMLGLVMGIFNENFKTNYFFVSFTSNLAARGTILESLGNGYSYFINLEIVTICYFIILFITLKLIEIRSIRKYKYNLLIDNNTY